jgi:hypothetical protein
LTDTDPGTFAFSFDEGASLTLGWSVVSAINGPGSDIVLFELGTPDSWNVTINGTTLLETPVDTGFTEGGFSLNAAAFDLSDFGIASGGSISQLHLTFNPGGTVASTSLVGALYTTSAVPEPSRWAMLAAGFAGLGLLGWKRSRASTVTFKQS